MSFTFPHALLLEEDYITLAKRLLDGTPCEPREVRLENPEPYTLKLIVAHEDIRYALAATELLKEFWLYDWMPINTLIVFTASIINRREKEHGDSHHT